MRFFIPKHTNILLLPWYPELVPQIIGGVLPATPVIENVSVKHCVAAVIAVPVEPETLPPICTSTEVVEVLGPAITNVLKSKRS